jgi:hypothetical protein
VKLYPGQSDVVGVGVGAELVVLIVDVGCRLAMYGEDVALELEFAS